MHTLTAITGTSPRKIATRLILLTVSAIVLFGFAPQLTDMWSQLPELAQGRGARLFFLIAVALELASFACSWALIRLAIPSTSWFVAATAQLAGNAVSRSMPGGGATGGAVQYRMLSVSGIDKSRAGAALAGNSIVSTMVLAGLPVVTIVWATLTSRVERINESLALGAWVGGGLFLVFVAISVLISRFDRPLRGFGVLIERITTPIYRRIGRAGPTAAGMIHARDRLVTDLRPHWGRALGAAIGNWLFDFLVLVAALAASHSNIRSARLPILLLAYVSAAVLAMIPITPGGLGFVEAGLTSLLVAAGVTEPKALLATLAYRIVSYWLPIAVGAIAYLVYRRRYGPAHHDNGLETAHPGG